MMRTPLPVMLNMLLLPALAAFFLIAGTFVAPGALAGEAVPCDIQRGPCSLMTADGTSLVFDALPRPVTAMTELTFTVTLSKNGTPVRDAEVTLDLSMPGMFMGRNRPVLRHAADGRYEGKGIITRCASGKKTWQAAVTATFSKRTSEAAFVFEVK